VRKNGRSFSSFCGTLDYAAPEILNGYKYDGPPQDVWSMGILLYTLVYKENPFYNMDEIVGGNLRIPFHLSQGKKKAIVMCGY
jgi:protein-serine/threonine kinase